MHDASLVIIKITAFKLGLANWGWQIGAGKLGLANWG
jgi:hypothetical protein